MGKPVHKKGRTHIKEKKEFDEEVIQIDRVTRVVKGGRRLRFRATVAIGDRKGRVGIGIGKSTEVTGAIHKAISKAKRSIIRVPLFGTTIPHEIKMKFKSSKILMLPASEGTGIIAGGAIRKVVDLAGIKNILSKSFGTNNRVSNTQAAFKALGMLQKRRAPKKIKEEQEVKETKSETKSDVEGKKVEKVEKKPEPTKS